jgi:hypothetical protein
VPEKLNLWGKSFIWSSRLFTPPLGGIKVLSTVTPPNDITLTAEESSHPHLPHLVVLTIKVWRTQTPFLVHHIWILDWLESQRSLTCLIPIEQPIRRPESGECMGVDKKSSPKSRTRLYPIFTTKDSHMTLPWSRSHNGPTNPRNKSQTNHKRKRNSRSKGLRRSVKPEEHDPRCTGGWSVLTVNFCQPRVLVIHLFRL